MGRKSHTWAPLRPFRDNEAWIQLGQESPVMIKKGLREGREANMGHKGLSQTEYFSSLHNILPLLNPFQYIKTKLRCTGTIFMTLFASCYVKYYVLPNGDAATFRNEANLSEIHCMKVKLSKMDAKMKN
jgi:hypothetical protein